MERCDLLQILIWTPGSAALANTCPWWASQLLGKNSGKCKLWPMVLHKKCLTSKRKEKPRNLKFYQQNWRRELLRVLFAFRDRREWWSDLCFCLFFLKANSYAYHKHMLYILFSFVCFEGLISKLGICMRGC